VSEFADADALCAAREPWLLHEIATRAGYLDDRLPGFLADTRDGCAFPMNIEGCIVLIDLIDKLYAV
jgi:hypothetical protein